MPAEQPDFETELTAEDEADSKEQYWRDEYVDREGENTAASADDRSIEMSDFLCEKCGRKTRQRVSVIFKPMCCGRPMKEVKRVEKNTGYDALVKKAKKKAAAEAKAAKKAAKKAKKKLVKAAKAKKKAKKAKKAKIKLKKKPSPKPRKAKAKKAPKKPKKALKAKKKAKKKR